MTNLAQTARQNREAAVKSRAGNLLRIDFATVERLGNKAAALSRKDRSEEEPKHLSDIGMRQVIRPSIAIVSQLAMPLAA